MTGRDARDDVEGYGIAPWIGGALLGAAPIATLVLFASSISGGTP